MNVELGDVVARASQITWRHKILWVFNMFPVLLSFIFVPIVFIPMFFIGPNALIHQNSVNQSYYVSLFVVFNLILSALSILLSAAGAASSSLGILRVENGRDQLAFRDLFQDGLEYFWRILGITLLIGGLATLIILLLSGAVVMLGMATQGVGMICFPPLFFFLYPGMLMAYALVELSQAAVIADRMDMLDAIARGQSLIKAHFRRFVLISLVIYLGIFMLSSIVVLPFVLPFFFLPLTMENPQAGFEPESFGWLLILFSAVLLPILALIQGVALTYIKSAFMIVYLRLTRSTILQTA